MTSEEAVGRIERAPEYTEDEVVEAIDFLVGDHIDEMVSRMTTQEKRGVLRLANHMRNTGG